MEVSSANRQNTWLEILADVGLDIERDVMIPKLKRACYQVRVVLEETKFFDVVHVAAMATIEDEMQLRFIPCRSFFRSGAGHISMSQHQEAFVIQDLLHLAEL